ncbi:MAG: hypothetical protein QXO71_00055 [Candidatus Jordarchaeaceae archaeon]
MFETFPLTKALLSPLILPFVISIIVGAISIILAIFKPQLYDALKTFSSPFLKGTWEFLKKFWKQLIFITITVFISTLTVDTLLPDYFNQHPTTRTIYLLFTFTLLNINTITYHHFKTDKTWFLRTLLASTIILSTAILYYFLNYPTYSLIPPPFD